MTTVRVEYDHSKRTGVVTNCAIAMVDAIRLFISIDPAALRVHTDQASFARASIDQPWCSINWRGSDQMKRCRKCGITQALTDFYADPRARDSRMNKCQTCCREDARVNYVRNRQQRQAAQRARTVPPEKAREYTRATRARHPERWRARATVERLLKDGVLVRRPCEICGAVETQAHHLSYGGALDIQWLCFRHHQLEHGHIPAGVNQ